MLVSLSFTWFYSLICLTACYIHLIWTDLWILWKFSFLLHRLVDFRNRLIVLAYHYRWYLLLNIFCVVLLLLLIICFQSFLSLNFLITFLFITTITFWFLTFILCLFLSYSLFECKYLIFKFLILYLLLNFI